MKRWMRSVLAFSLAISLMIPGLAENASPVEAETGGGERRGS